MPVQLVVTLFAIALATLLLIRPSAIQRLLPDGERIVDFKSKALRGTNRLLDDAVRKAEQSTFRVGPKVYMPDDVFVDANPADFAVEPEDFAYFLKDRLSSRSEELGYAFAARLKVRARADPKLRPGRPVIDARVTTGTSVIGATTPHSTALIDDEELPIGYSFVPKDERWTQLDMTFGGETFIIGSSRLQADVQLDHRAVSARHAELKLDETGRLWIRDLGSTNGTFISDERLSAHRWSELGPDQVLRLGPNGHGMPEWVAMKASVSAKED